MVDITVLVHDTLLSILSEKLTSASIWPLRALLAAISNIALVVLDTCGFGSATRANQITGARFAHSVSFANTAIFEILSEILSELTSFISVLVINLRISLVDIGVALVLVLGGYPSKLASL
jgi:hypothetical protein